MLYVFEKWKLLKYIIHSNLRFVNDKLHKFPKL